jgi:hypothetical protein
MAYNFQTGDKKVKLLTEYESVTQKVLFGNGILATRGGICHRRRGNVQKYFHLYPFTPELDSLERSGTNHNTPIALY